MPPPGASGFTGLLSDKDKDDVADILSGSGGAEVSAALGKALGGLLSGYKDKIVRDEEDKNKKSSEKFGDLEYTAEVKSKLGPHMSGYYSPLLKDPSKFIHVLKQKKGKVHPDDVYSLGSMGGTAIGGFYSPTSNPTVTLDDVLQQVLGPKNPLTNKKDPISSTEWHAKKQNPHQGSPWSALETSQKIQPGNLYLNPKALTGAWEPSQPSKTGHPMDIIGHELGHSTRNLLGAKVYDFEGNLVNDEAIQRYEDAIYGFSPLQKEQAIKHMPFNKMTENAPMAWGLSMQKIQDRPDAWATPLGKHPTLNTIYDNWSNYGPRQRDKERRGAYW